MKRFLGLLLAASLLGTAAHAQSTMPAMGANTPKGEVAKTDASINSTNADKRNNRSQAKQKPAKRTGSKMKMKEQEQSTM